MHSLVSALLLATQTYPVAPRGFPESEEIALALSAAPEEISSRADIYVLRGTEFVKVRSGTNGCACMVARDAHDGSRYPICYDREGVTTTMAREMLEGSLRAKGVPEVEVQRRVSASYESGALRRPAKASVAYMMSAQQVLFSAPDSSGFRVGPWYPHIMIMLPSVEPAQLGLAAESKVDFLQIHRQGQGHSELIVKVPAWSNGVPARASGASQSDTIRIEVGSPALDGRVYKPHAARVRVRIGDSSRVTGTWTNELTIGDSAGRPVMRWVTKGTQYPPSGPEVTWELRQTYDARTLAPLTYSQTSSTGRSQHLTITDRRVRGTRRVPGDTAAQQVDVTLDRPGFFAGASDLVPLAVGLKQGAVMTAPVWSPAMTKAEVRIFSVLGKATVDVEGTRIEAWKVEERRESDRVLLATWYLLDKSPYMVYGEVPLPNGQVQRMTEVEIPSSMPD
jgi:hypothetical protein